MQRYAVTFFSDSVGISLQVIEAESRDLALRSFFDSHVTGYTKDNEGFAYFREDFNDADRPMGAVLELTPNF